MNEMDDMNRLYILWTTDNEITSRDMVFMYAGNAVSYGWWEVVTIIVWGASAALAARNPAIAAELKRLMSAGVRIVACRACAERHDAVDALSEAGVRVDYIGSELTDILKSGDKVITV